MDGQPKIDSSTGSGPVRDERWFEDLFRRHHGALRAYLLRRVPEDTDDVVAEVFTIAWRKRDAVPDRVLPWLYGVASREVLHILRTRSRQGTLISRLATTASTSVADTAADTDDRVAAYGPVTQALGRLSGADAEVLRLWAWEQLEPGEIAEVLEISPVAARVRLHRARRRFEATLATSASSGSALDGAQFRVDRPMSSLLTETEYSHD